jgi:hypothetical protein
MAYITQKVPVLICHTTWGHIPSDRTIYTSLFLYFISESNLLLPSSVQDAEDGGS